MKKRLLKKTVANMSNNELFEHVAYCENKRLRKITEREFDKRLEGINRESLRKH
ncbi:hypothetical protein [Bacillus sp. NTK034]|uniref:hypothetical protein n=1 Tax=Bacillus sp. NTK034 TaxID=2802176 RepID=UPI001A8CA536|nr:hypothetical protein [Bacillus sp. NTK034]MBN8200507.1 hypothetical protein [Bacillus sp. NTK034]